MATFSKAITKVLKHEGGYMNDSFDYGGETNFGISKRAYPNLDIKNLTIEDAKAIYKRDYWDKIKGDQIECEELALNIFDMAVNAGVGTAVKLVQIVCKVGVDGVFGSKTLAAVNGIGRKLNDSYTLERVKHYVNICNRNQSQNKFLRGWLNRVLGE